MKRLSFLIGVVFAVSSIAAPTATALRYPPGFNNSGYIAVNLLGPTEVQSGDNFTYTIILTNDGSGYARNVQVTYLIPDGIRWLDRFSHGTCEQRINEIICTYDLIQPGSRSIPLNLITDRLVHTSSAFCPRTITSSARISTMSSDTFADDNVSPLLSTRITCYDPPNRSYRQSVDLQINLTAPQRMVSGDTATLSAIVTNAGTDTAVFVTMLMSIPSGLSTRNLPRFCQITGNMITCTNFTLRSGESRVLTFIMPLSSSFSCPASLEWRAQVYSGSQNSYGIYRTSTARTSVACQPALTIPSPSSFRPPSSGGNHNGNMQGGGGGWATYNGSYSDPLHICDLPLDVIFPCPLPSNRSTGGGGSTGGSDGEEIDIHPYPLLKPRPKEEGIHEEDGIPPPLLKPRPKEEGIHEEDGIPPPLLKPRPKEDGIHESLHLPPDSSGNWVWNGQGWIYSTLAPVKPTMDLDKWTLQLCTGNERGTITYEIGIANNFEVPIDTIDVVEMLNPTAVCIKNAHGGLIGPRHILWQIDSIAPFSTHALQYTVGILPHVSDQFIIANLTHAGTSGPHILMRDFEMVEVSRQIEKEYSSTPSP